MRRSFAALALVAALAGCGSMVQGPPGTGTSTTTTSEALAFNDASAGQAMVAARVSYNVAVSAATAYGRLPACSATQRAPCHDPATLSQIGKADRVAFEALDAADVILRRPSLGTLARDRAIQAALAALAAFQAITNR